MLELQLELSFYKVTGPQSPPLELCQASKNLCGGGSAEAREALLIWILNVRCGHREASAQYHPCTHACKDNAGDPQDRHV